MSSLAFDVSSLAKWLKDTQINNKKTGGCATYSKYHNNIDNSAIADDDDDIALIMHGGDDDGDSDDIALIMHGGDTRATEKDAALAPITVIDIAENDSAYIKITDRQFSFAMQDAFNRILIPRMIRSIVDEKASGTVHKSVGDIMKNQPFIIVDLIRQGAIPIYNHKFAFESRVLLNEVIDAIEETDFNEANPDASPRTRIAENDPINVIKLYIPLPLISPYCYNIPRSISYNLYKYNFSKIAKHIISSPITFKKIYNISVIEQKSEDILTLSHNSNIIDILVLRELIKFYNSFYKNHLAIYETANRIYNMMSGAIHDTSLILNDSIAQQSANGDRGSEGRSPASYVKMYYNYSNELVNFMTDIGIEPFETEFADAVLASIFNKGFIIDYINIIVLQTPNYKIDTFALKYKPTFRHQTIDDLMLLSHYKHIYRQLYGNNRFNKIKDIQTIINFIKTISAEEYEIIKQEQRKQVAYWEQVGDNKCVHIELVYRLYKAQDVDTIGSLLGEVSELIDKDDAAVTKKKQNETPQRTSMYKCKLCDFNMICPHKLEYLTLLLKNPHSFSKNRSELDKYIDNDMRDPVAYCCKICGDQLYIRELSVNTNVRQNSMISREEMQVLQSEAGAIISKYTKQLELIDTFQLSRSMIDTCYPYIAIYRQKNALKFNVEFEVLNYIRLIFAAYLHNASKIKSNFIEFDLKKFKESLSFKSRNISVVMIDKLISTLIDINVATAKRRYKSTEDIIASNVIFINAMHIERVNLRDYSGKKRDEWIAAKLKYKNNIYENLKEVTLPTNRKDYDSAITYLREMQIMAMYNIQLKYVHSRKWLCTKSIDDIEHIDPMLRPSKEILDIERTLMRRHELMMRRPFSSIPVGFSMRFDESPVSLAEIYDKHGNRHIWDQFVYSPTAKNKEYKNDNSDIGSKKDNIFIRSAVPLVHGDLIDVFASNTMTYRSKTKDISEKDVIYALNRKNQINSLFNYYSNRCPKGGLHEKIGDNNKCTKCGKMDNMNTQMRAEYFDNFLANYEKDVLADAKDTSYGYKTIPIPAPKTKLKDTPVVWDVNIIKQVANILNIPYNVLHQLGGMQGVLYNDILGGYEPPIDSNNNSYRVYLLDSYIRLYFTQKVSSGYDDIAFSKYSKTYDRYRNILPTADLLQFMYMTFYNNILDSYSTNPSLIKGIVEKIVYSDSLLCKNTPINKQVITDMDEHYNTDLEAPEKIDDENPEAGTYDAFDYDGIND